MRAKDLRDMVAFGFLKGTVGVDAKFFTLKANAPKRGAVTMIAGKLGSAGRKTVRGFAVRADMRDFLEKTIARKTAEGFVRIS